jgi:hypothetical protein
VDVNEDRLRIAARVAPLVDGQLVLIAVGDRVSDIRQGAVEALRAGGKSPRGPFLGQDVLSVLSRL